jgi:hypothetical protein
MLDVLTHNLEHGVVALTKDPFTKVRRSFGACVDTEAYFKRRPLN